MMGCMKVPTEESIKLILIWLLVKSERMINEARVLRVGNADVRNHIVLSKGLTLKIYSYGLSLTYSY